ncbi:MAG: hypothetical protein ACRDRX_25215 [Pseudonocardiaceae bacterium]
MSRVHAGDRIRLVCRVTALSRYNPDPLCSVCQRACRDTAGIVPSWLWDSEPMRAALARVDIPAVVAIFRAAAGLSQLELGNLVEGWSQSLVQQGTCLARYTGCRDHAREALRFAGRATEAARYEPSPALHALISLRQALAHAQLGDDVAFRSAITTARRELDRGPHDADSTLTSVRVLRELRPVRDAAGAARQEFCDRFDTAARALSAA